MSRSCCLAVIGFLWAGSLLANALPADDPELWREFGLVHVDTGKSGKLSYTAYQMKDLTGALAAWEWQRTPQGRSCDAAPLCTTDGNNTIVSDANYLVVFNKTHVTKAAADAVLGSLPDRRDSSLPAILTFLPRTGLVPNSARYVLGEASFKAFAPELAGTQAGFDQGAEAQVAEYTLPNFNGPAHLAIFYYPTPEMARLHSTSFRTLPDVFVKRSGVLVSIVYDHATQAQADSLLSRVQYEAKITWNDTPPPPPIKPLYRLLLNIMYMCILLGCLCLTAGLIYGGMRIYRRRFGQLEQQEAMTTLHLAGD